MISNNTAKTSDRICSIMKRGAIRKYKTAATPKNTLNTSSNHRLVECVRLQPLSTLQLGKEGVCSAF